MFEPGTEAGTCVVNFSTKYEFANPIHRYVRVAIPFARLPPCMRRACAVREPFARRADDCAGSPRQIAGLFITGVFQEMMPAFEKRAAKLYGHRQASAAGSVAAEPSRKRRSRAEADAAGTGTGDDADTPSSVAAQVVDTVSRPLSKPRYTSRRQRPVIKNSTSIW